MTSHVHKDDAVSALAHIRGTLRSEAARYGAELKELPEIIAVSKSFPASAIMPLLGGGHRQFGENRVQEAKEKWPALKTKFPDITLHLIGPLQSNKVPDAVALFDVIHTLDRESLAQALVKVRDKTGRCPMLFIQINTGDEAQKSGISPKHADAFISLCTKEFNLPVKGLMCIPPATQEPAPHFALLREIAKRHDLPYLSMGMSGDYAIAAALGATHLRIGSAIFGERIT